MAIALSQPPVPPHLVRRHALEKLLRKDGSVDWSPWYLTEEEDMGQSVEQGELIDVLGSSLKVLSEEKGWSPIYIAGDNFFAWVEGEPYVQVSPDIYLLDMVPPPDQPLPRRFEVWREHIPPRFALEIVSTDWRKDYDINPARYDHLGVSELVLADSEAVKRDLSGKGRAPFVVYRRNASDRMELAYMGDGPVFCVEIDSYLIFHSSSPERPRVRISRNAAGNDIVPTLTEKAAAAEQRAASAEQKVDAAEQKAAAAEQKAAAAEQKAAAAEQKAAAQAAELDALRARLRTLEDS